MIKFFKIMTVIGCLSLTPFLVWADDEYEEDEEYYYDEFDDYNQWSQQQDIYYQQQQQINEGQLIVDVASQYIGNPYVYGGSSLTEGCDCSHFVWLVLIEAIGYQSQYATSWGFETLGQPVESLEEAAAGDVICYGHHVAIYDGEGMIIQAKGSQYGITYDREADCSPIVAIRRFTN